MSKLETIRSEWKLYRSVVHDSEDWPTTANSYNPAATVTHRLVSRMLTKAEAVLPSMAIDALWNALELRARFSDAGATGTFHLLGCRRGDASVKLAATVVATAGSQVAADGTFHATTLTVTSYWPKTITMSNEPTGSGMCTIDFDMRGWSDFWGGVTAVSVGTLHLDYAGF
jgi:hypothetical protein